MLIHRVSKTSALATEPLRRRPYCRLLTVAVLFAMLVSILPSVLYGEVVNESDISPSLLAAVREVTGLVPIFPTTTENPFFNITELDISGRSVSSLKGIRYFSALTSLAVDYNKLTTLRGIDFPSGISSLSLSQNSISDLTLVVWPAALTSLDLRNNRLTNPLDTAFPDGIATIQIDNNFLTVKTIGAPRGCAVSYGGNFIFEANAIRPATLVVKDVQGINLSPGEQKPIPFVSITSSTNPGNQVPPKLLQATIAGSNDMEEVVSLEREEYRFLVTAKNSGSDSLTISLALTMYQFSY